MLVVVFLEVDELSFQIAGIPEERVIKKLTANGSDQTFHKDMRSRDVRNAFDFLDIQDA
jgi:hypothetical protein